MDEYNNYNLQSILNTFKFEYPIELSEWALCPWHICKVINEIIGNNATTIVELGSGTSSVVIAKALEKRKKGKLYSFDQVEEYTKKIKNRILAENVNEKYFEIKYAEPVSIQVNAKEFYWYDMSTFKDINNIDILIIDGPSALLPGGDKKQVRYPALPMLYEKLSKNSIVILDDYNRPDEQEIVEKWKSEFKIDYIEIQGSPKGLAILYINK